MPTIFRRPFNIASSKEECQRKTKLAVEILRNLGLIINSRKSRLEPAQVFEWLGLQFNLKNHSVKVSQEKNMCLQRNLREVIEEKWCTKRSVMKLQGLANWVGQCDPFIKLMMIYTRRILRCFKRQNLDVPIQINKGLKLSLCKWITTVSIPQCLGNPAPDVLIQTDASRRGWGFQIGQKQYAGNFDHSMCYSVNVLELITI